MLSSGSVIGPTFHFNIPKLKFGVVSYGKCQIHVHYTEGIHCLVLSLLSVLYNSVHALGEIVATCDESSRKKLVHNQTLPTVVS